MEPVVRVLVVDDFKPWLDYLKMLFEPTAGMMVVGTATDGHEAISQVRALQPDLILMDVSLPQMSGIEAAREIIRLLPDAKIIFVSQHKDTSVVQAAIAAGGKGYVMKLDAGNELLSAIESVVLGQRYFSRGLLGLDLSESLEM
jgi:DNA-binding NarL/FixJ family response regulator